ncbi:MAG: DUF5615 family PIN-like protein [Pyrinomonadaceae bacterium]|nr:DUF5615 family PIN-like protein [Pyrinomonadaceae bacterium]
MKFLADENIEREFVETLRSENFDVLYVKEIQFGIADDEVLRLANDNEAIILTADKDFGELVIRLGLASKGVVLLRLGEIDLKDKIEITMKALREHADELPNAFTVISSNSIRIRK